LAEVKQASSEALATEDTRQALKKINKNIPGIIAKLEHCREGTNVWVL
jgi:hypothetical protein